ncbi:YchE family NAAT transporter [Methylobacillus gramineus]|uniref:YchE family NAAT transporter n=1 Tax=Methylobacillus gramineus TaxID=755169 RepID=UPI001CFF66C7|nr:YchE family NAAT transporter [Methylobacillus gramineus]MCB5186358.1 YchE family NAAT transporter [Methylobacillus gramineus]
MAEWALIFKTAIALFAIVNPIGVIPIFISATDGWPAKDRAHTANTVAITVFIVLTVSALLGESILEFFSISIPSFQVGGGILVMLIAISMMHGKQSTTRQTPEEAQETAERNVIAVVPLSIPLLAGPGAISSMIITAQQSGSFWGHISLALPIAVVCLAIWLALRLSMHIAQRLGTIGINVVTRLMGLILAAMAVEFIAHGISGLFPSLAS